MRITDLKPALDLAPFVRSVRIVESSEEIVTNLVPDNSFSIGFRYAGASALIEHEVAQIVPNCSISGIRATALRMQTGAASGTLIARFTDAGASFFLDGPIDALFGQTEPLVRWMPRDAVERASTQIHEACDEDERVACLEDFLRGQWRPRDIDGAVIAALKAIYETHGELRVRELAEHVHLSPDALEKRFRLRVGASPKQFTSVIRLRRSIDPHADDTSLSDLVETAGYYDQSHFIRTFRAMQSDARIGLET